MSLSLVTFLLTAKHASPIQIQAFFLGQALNLWFSNFPLFCYKHCWHRWLSTKPFSDIFLCYICALQNHCK